MNACDGLDYQLADYDTTLDVPEIVTTLFHPLQWRALVVVNIDDLLSNVSTIGNNARKDVGSKPVL